MKTLDQERQEQIEVDQKRAARDDAKRRATNAEGEIASIDERLAEFARSTTQLDTIATAANALPASLPAGNGRDVQTSLLGLCAAARKHVDQQTTRLRDHRVAAAKQLKDARAFLGNAA